MEYNNEQLRNSMIHMKDATSVGIEQTQIVENPLGNFGSSWKGKNSALCYLVRIFLNPLKTIKN
jgi:hypothetical protein